MPSTGTSPTSSEGTHLLRPNGILIHLGGDFAPPGRTGTQSFMQRRRASFGKARSEGADPHADRMLQGHFSID
jgi:hypothetical protein